MVRAHLPRPHAMWTCTPSTSRSSSLGLLFCQHKSFQHPQPLFVRALVDVQVVIDTLQKFAFHSVDFREGNARDVRPSAVRVRVARTNVS